MKEWDREELLKEIKARLARAYRLALRLEEHKLAEAIELAEERLVLIQAFENKGR